ncbi:unnamed protein product [[Candida] boidinii]|nr:unnamed protein product [[Candida] boidinii]GMG27348.1 unnamed protein product [[Candida] boidinii]
MWDLQTKQLIKRLNCIYDDNDDKDDKDDQDESTTTSSSSSSPLSSKVIIHVDSYDDGKILASISLDGNVFIWDSV